MLLIAGYIVVFVSAMAGFMIAGGNPLVLLHVSEFIMIGGMTIGVMLVAAPKPVIVKMVEDIKHELHGGGIDKEEYLDLLKVLYEIFMIGRRNGLIALDEHVSDPSSSSIFTKYPGVSAHADRMEFLCNALRPIIDGKIKPDQLQEVLEGEIETMEKEGHGPVGILHLIGDSLPGIGIVAAVLGIINTMGAIADGPEVVGYKVAAALTGTFLGIFAAYGFVNPLTEKIHTNHAAHSLYFTIMAKAISGFAKGLAPMMAIEIARRNLEKANQPTADELEQMLKNLNSS